ncbi:hypothetical protein JHK86_001438 [Glycine max]|nr:hypothetical protein JHK86_001438 [Glycine max]
MFVLLVSLSIAGANKYLTSYVAIPSHSEEPLGNGIRSFFFMLAVAIVEGKILFVLISWYDLWENHTAKLSHCSWRV